MAALFNEKFSADRNLMQGQVAAYRTALAANRDVTTAAFPVLAARMGIAPGPFHPAAADTLAHHLGRNLVHGRFAGSTITAAQYAAYTAQLPATPPPPSERAARAVCLDFFKHYAFDTGYTTTSSSSTRPAAAAAATTHEACIYLLGSLINHSCTPLSPFLPIHHTHTHTHTHTHNHSHKPSHKPSLGNPTNPITNGSGSSSSSSGGPNCSWRIGPSGLAHFVRPRHICVQARRAIRAGEQLTWDYGKREKGFVCECDTCRDGFLAGLGDSCGVL
ncbi:hypothetical protein BT67DRAFT_444251 [Trichocladium antarcticum]|uniref:SET domain-containing protein n=1 Tax=Trichocladium antarcticum TaxID=1450529 RepID=A0AAN6UFM3_9PEZI|nr:hypothetical protein BT67DRAFT_444251 [Trichocladium antarcticum]